MSEASPGRSAPDTVDSATFRRVLGRYPTGVVVVTAVDDDGPVAMVIGSFVSVSLDPPLVGFLPAKTSSSWPRIERAGRFCVNVMGADQLPICNAFFRKEGDPWETLDWTHSPTGSPLLEGSLAWIDCTIDNVVDAGDHWMALGWVVALDCADEGDPLLFYSGGYGTYREL